MGPLIRVHENMFHLVEKLLHYRYWDKGRERSNRTTALYQGARGTKRTCPMRHNRICLTGPPHDQIRAYICLWCNAGACEPEIVVRGFDFNTVPDWIIYEILDLDLQRQAELNSKMFGGFQGGFDDAN